MVSESLNIMVESGVSSESCMVVIIQPCLPSITPRVSLALTNIGRDVDAECCDGFFRWVLEQLGHQQVVVLHANRKLLHVCAKKKRVIFRRSSNMEKKKAVSSSGQFPTMPLIFIHWYKYHS